MRQILKHDVLPIRVCHGQYYPCSPPVRVSDGRFRSLGGSASSDTMLASCSRQPGIVHERAAYRNIINLDGPSRRHESNPG